MHIAYWSPAWPLEKFQNGVVSYVHWMKKELEGRGHAVSVFTGHLHPETSEPNVKIARRSIWDRARNRVPGLWRSPEVRVFDFAHAISSAVLRVHRRNP